MLRLPALVRALCVLLMVVWAGCSTGSSGPAQPAVAKPTVKRIVFITNGDDPFWSTCRAGLEEGEKLHNLAAAGLKADFDLNSGGAQGQIERLRQYATQDDVAGIAISVVQADNQAIIDELLNLQKKGIKVITVDGDVNRELYRDARPFYIGTDNIVGGRTLGTATKAVLAAKKVDAGGYVQFAGYTDNDNARSRMNGVQEALGAAYVERDRMADDMDHQRARDNVRNAITNHKDLVALIGIWAYNAPAIADVALETSTRDKFVIGTFDAQALAIAAMEKGNIDVMVVQNPFDMGIQTCRLMKAMLGGDEATIKEMFPNQGQPDGDIYTTGLRVVVPSADSPIKPELFDAKVVEYLLLPDFKAWLAKYRLTDS
ncbi:MAG: substrate-binding domain-containing protein [Pirellulaceae bacterium]|nr:substrate-binding domain-containing protein [Pirellulaceae bacterium]